jgi:PAS domain S-box-containing protein
MNGNGNENMMLVGIGASAGGVEALLQFFENMPDDTGLAFVVILHLAPEHESRLAEVLQAKTRMAVTQVTEPVRVEPNHVYVIPPDRDLYMADGHIRLAERERGEGRTAPVDLFFRTLADSYRDRAIAVVLSGAGTDGSLGLGRIKEQGGVSFAQTLSEAEHGAMPRAAVETGSVDFVLPVATMPDKIVSLQRNAVRIRLPPAEAPPPDAHEDALRELLGLLRARTRHDFFDYKRSTLLRRVERRMQVTQTVDLPAYLEHVRNQPAELQGLLADLLISVTSFFRDPEAFAGLEAEGVPRLFAGKDAGDQVRLWVTGCATGEEAYSIAMLLAEYAERLESPPAIQVFASDIDEQALGRARAGVYPDSIAADLSPERLARFFVREGQYHRVKRELREMVLFSPHNVLRDPPFSKLDMVSCRNLLIYINRQTQERVLEIFHFALKPGGFLFLGTSETAEGVPGLFASVDKQHHLYQRLDAVSVFRGAPTLPAPGRWTVRGITMPEPPPPGEAREPLGFGELHYRTLEVLAPPSVLVDAEYEIIHLSEHAYRFLRFTGREPSRNLLMAAHPDLRLELRSLLLEAAQRGDASRNVRISLDGELRVVRISAHPVTSPRSAPGLQVVIFDDLKEAPPPVDVAVAPPAEGDSRMESLVRQLEEELQLTKGRLQTTVEQYETQAEEFKAANEELQAMNEELRSASEELETGKEELQSVNEELTTLNAELKERVEEVGRANSDLQNLMEATQIGTLFLDRNLRVKRYTPSVRGLFNLIPGDIGRPVAHVTHGLDYEGLGEEAAEVLRTLHPIEREVAAKDGRHLLMRLMPYRTLDDRISGVVVTFVDITGRRRAEEAVRASEERLQKALNIETVGVIFFNDDIEIIDCNEAFLRMSGLTRAEIKAGRFSWEAFTPEEFIQPSRRAIEELRTRGFSTPYEKEYIRKDGSRFWALFACKRIGENELVEFVTDITERKRAEEALRESEKQFRSAIEDAPIPVIMHAEDGEVLQISRTWTELTGYTIEDAPTFEAWLTRAYGEGADAVRNHVHRLFGGERGSISIDFPVRTRDGEVRHWSFNASSPGTLRDGRRFIVGMAVDITERQLAEEAIRAAGEQLRLVVDSVEDYCIFTTDTEGRITTWNQGAERLFGYTEEEAVGQNIEIIFTPEDRERGAHEEEMRQARETGRAADERWHVSKQGVRFYVSGVLAALRYDGGGLTGYAKIARDLTERKELEDALRRAHDEMEGHVRERTMELAEANVALHEEVRERRAAEERVKNLLKQLVTVQEEERRRIARELHDTLGQQLAALSLSIDMIKAESQGRARLREHVERTQSIFDRLNSDVDFLAWELRPAVLDQLGLGAAVQTFLVEWSRHFGVEAHYRGLGGDAPRLPSKVETNLYRILQEALQNVHKHASAGRVSVLLERRDAQVVLIVEDNGKGYDPDEEGAADMNKGMGVTNMSERAALVGGSLEIESVAGQGTTIFVRIPLAETEEGDLSDGRG